MIPDPLRDRADRVIQALALADNPDAIDKIMNLSRSLVADIAKDPRGDLAEMILHTLDAARLRCPDPHPDADLGGDAGPDDADGREGEG